jgi:hypothetical protein
MLNEVKHLVIAWEILRGVYPRAKRRAQNDIVHHLTCDKAKRFCYLFCRSYNVNLFAKKVNA